jgi:PAS domain S-box-containing protein
LDNDQHQKQGLISPPAQVSIAYLTSHLFFLLVIALIFYLALKQIDQASALLKIQLIQKELAEKEYIRSETRFRQMLELSPLPIMIINTDQKVEFMNNRLTEVLGYTIEDIPNEAAWFQTVYPDPKFREWVNKQWSQEIKKIRQSGGIIQEEFEVYDKWSQPHQVDFFANVIEDKSILILNDVTEQRRMEAEIRASELLYRALFDNVQDGIFLMDGDRFVECNQQILNLFGCQRDQIIGKTPLKFSPDRQPNGADSKLAIQYHLKKTLEKSPQTFEWHHTRLDGSPFMAQITLSRTTLPQGDFFLAQVRDISKQKQDQATIQRSTRRMDALYNLETVISTSFNLQTILTIFLDLIIDQSEADAASFLLYDSDLQILKFSGGLGFHTNLQPSTARFQIGFSLAGKAALTRQPVYVDDFSKIKMNESLKKLVEAEEFIFYCGIPMVVKGELKGVLEIFQRHISADPSEWFTYIETLANRAAIAIDNAHLFSNLQHANLQMQNTYDTTLEGWVYLLSQRDDETEEHTRRVVVLTELLAKKIGVKNHELVHILRGALLHDIGKIVVPDRILFKPGPLDDAEWKIMRQHPAAAYQSLVRIDYLKQAIDIPYCHHERWDGTGYPRGLKGKQIPLAARIFAIIDVWDALSHDRPYRKAWEKEKILAYMQTQSGRHFDPDILPVFMDMIQNNSGLPLNNGDQQFTSNP